MSHAALGIIVSQFPETHETFIVRELTALRNAGIPLRIYSLKRCRDRIVHPEAKTLLGETVYVTWHDPRVWVEAVAEFCRRPGRVLGALGWTVRHHAWPPITLIKALVVWVQALALSQRMSRDGVRHLHAHWATMPTTAAVVASHVGGAPFSFTAHAWDVFVRNPSLPEKVRQAERVFTCTDYNRRYLAHWCPAQRDKIVLSYHGVNLEQFRNQGEAATAIGDGSFFQGEGSGKREPSPLFLSVGRLVETKGYETLLDAYQQLRAKDVAFRAVIVGDGPLRRELERHIRMAGLDGSVTLTSTLPQNELRQLYANASAFVLPCTIARNDDRDGIPNVILEAMAMGLPVVSTSISGIPEAIQDRRNGLLVGPGRAEELSEAMEWLLQRPSFARVLGDHGRMWVETQFDERDHLQRLVRQFEELLDGPQASEPPMAVMYVIWSLEIGGAERLVVALAKGLDRRRFAPMVVCLNAAGALATDLRARGIPVIALHKGHGVDLRALWRLMRIMRRLKPHVVHTHLWGANVWGRIAARFAGVPTVVTTEHSVDTWKPSWYFVIDRWLARWTTGLIAVSHQVQAFYESQGVGRGRWQVVYNGVDLEGFQPRKRNGVYRALGINRYEPVVGFLGRLVPAKAPELFVEAVARAAREIPSLKAVIVGEGPLRDRLEAGLKRFHLERRVILTGARQDIPELLAGMDALICSSEREGFSMAVLEAMAAGVPVVATDVGGTRELIESGVSGVLVPAHQAQALGEHLIALLNNPARTAAIREAARRRVTEQFSLHKTLAAHERVYCDG